MVQVLERAQPKQSFSSQIGLGIGRGAVEGISGGIQQVQQRKAMAAENETLKRQGLDLAGISNPKIREIMIQEHQKSLGKKHAFADIFGKQNQGPSQGEQLQGIQDQQSGMMELTPEQETVLALQDPTAFNAYKHLKESRAKEKEVVKQKENLQGTFDEMTKTLLGGNLGKFTTGHITPEGRRDRQYFDTLNTQLESIGKEMVSKGVLSAPRFAFLMSNLPHSNNTDATNAGSLEAWAKELGMKVPEELQSLYKSESKNKSVKKPKESMKSKNTIPMMDSNGEIYDIPMDKMEEATAQGLVAQ